jgi:basic amino acid/polyamine antiporter, APA family
MNAVGDRGLLRAIGRWDLLALVINGIVGAGIFGLPAKVYALLGVSGLWAIIACALIIGLVILCFAEVASRFTQTGGPFVYAATAFGPFCGFLTGWVLWVARVTGCCAICSLLLQYTAYFSPALNEGFGRVAAAVFTVGGLTLVHFFGIKRTVLFGNIVTVGKLLPLLIFVGFGLLHLDPARFAGAGSPIHGHFAQAVLLLGFAFVGWESSVVTAGETRDPQRDLPFALLAGLAAVAILYLLIQVTCMGTLPQLSTSERPVVDAARTFLGAPGATLITVAAVISMLGTLNVTMLTVSRVPYAMALAGQLPRALGTVHPRYRTPHLAVVLSGILVLALTLSSSFIYLLTVSTIARLLVFAMTCASLPKLRRMATVPAARFKLPGGVIIPCAGLAMIAWLLSASSSWSESRDLTILILLGCLIYVLGGWRGKKTGSAVETPEALGTLEQEAKNHDSLRHSS